MSLSNEHCSSPPGTLGVSSVLRLRLGGLSFTDGAITDGGNADVRLQYAEVSSCSSTPSYGSFTTLGSFVSDAEEMDWKMDPPGNTYVEIPYPSRGGTRYYNYKIITRICDTSGFVNCTESKDTGCFSVNWI